MAVVINSPEKILEVRDAAGRLGLSSDLRKWNKEGVQKWILWAIREYYGMCLDLLEITGKELHELNIAEFQRRVPNLAVFFFNELQIWKKAYTKDPGEFREERLDEPPATYTDHHPNEPHSASPTVPQTIQVEAVNKSQEIPTSIDAIDSEVESPHGDDSSSIPNTSLLKEEILPTTVKTNPTEREENLTSPVLDDQVKSLPLTSSPYKVSTPKLTKEALKTPQAAPPQITLTSPLHTPVRHPFSSTLTSQNTPLSAATPSQLLFPKHPLATPTFNMMSPISPHVLANTSRLFIPPPPGFSLPFPNSPALMPHSPFRSPLLTPDSVHSPHYGLPDMETLRKNIERLEQQRKKHALSLEKGGEKLKIRRMKKQAAKIQAMQKRNSSGSVPLSSSELMVNPIDSVASSSVSMSSANTVVCKVEKDEENPTQSENMVTLDKNSNMKFIPCGKGHNILSPRDESGTSTGSEQSYSSSGDAANLSKGKRSVERRINKGHVIKIEPQGNCTSAATPVAVQQNSYEIPYYQATSLQASFEKQNSEILKVPKPERTLLNEDLASDKQNTLSSEHQLTPMNLTLPRPDSSAKESSSYSPISSPSDTEVEGEHPLFQQPTMSHPYHMSNIPNPLYNPSFACSSATSGAIGSYSAADNLSSPSIASYGQPQPMLLPDLSKLSGNTVEVGGNELVKIPKKRGRPPGTKPMQRPLGPNDIQKGFFRANHLWKFLLEMLEHPQQFGNYIQWLDRPNGVFKIINSAYVASLWGKRKNNGRMTYDKFSRSIRQYYKKGIIIKTKPSKLIYKFGAEFFNPNAQ